MTTTVVDRGASCAITESRVQVVPTVEAWESLWAEMHAHQEPVPAVPAVNFDEKVLIAAFRGDCPSGGYGLSVKAIGINKKNLSVNLLYTSPGKNCMSTMMITQPYEVVAIDRVDTKMMEVNVSSEKTDCDEGGSSGIGGPRPIPVEWEEVASGEYCGVGQEQSLLITDQASWEALWEQIGSIQSPPPKIPKVDFTEKALVALFMGERNTGGFSQQIEYMQLKNESLKVSIIHALPGKNCMVTEALTQPYLVVSIGKDYAVDPFFSVMNIGRDCD